MAVPTTQTPGRTRSTRAGVLCLEGEWDDDPRSRLSIEPALRLLELNEYISLVHRNVNTKAELEFHLTRMKRRGRPLYELVYLGFHGDKAGLAIGTEDLDLNELASLLGDAAEGQVVYLAGCSALGGPPKDLTDFCKRTKVRALAGYTRDVDWIESSAFELLVISQLVSYTHIRPLHTRVVRQQPYLARRLGFRMAHSTWASEIDSPKS